MKLGYAIRVRYAPANIYIAYFVVGLMRLKTNTLHVMDIFKYPREFNIMLMLAEFHSQATLILTAPFINVSEVQRIISRDQFVSLLKLC